MEEDRVGELISHGYWKRVVLANSTALYTFRDI